MDMEVDNVDTNSSNSRRPHDYGVVMNEECEHLQEHLEPRIGSSFQADIPAPAPVPVASVPAAAHPSLKATLQHRPNNKNDNNAFMSFCKNLTKESSDAVQFYSEEDEAMLTYLQQQAGGDIELGKLMLLNQLTAGESYSHRRFQKFLNRAHRTKFKQSQEKVLWQYLYDRSQSCSSFLGDLRSDVGGRNEYSASICTPSSNGTERDKLLTSTLSCTTGRGYADRSEMKVRWRSLMASAEGMLEKACSYSPAIAGSTRPTLRELLDLLTTAHEMPMPTESPGESFVENTVRTLNQILTLTSIARDCLASLHDVLHYDATAHVEGKGIDLERVKRALKRGKKAPVEVSEAQVVQRVVERASAWEQQVEEMLRLSSEAMAGDVSCKIDYLAKAEQLVEDAKILGPLSNLKSRIMLEKKIERAYVVKRRISGWDNENGRGNTENIKVIAAMVREVHRIGLYFFQVSRLMKVHAAAEEWMERATIVNRNRSSLSEVEQLIKSGEQIPVNLSDYLIKLEQKAILGRDWIRLFETVIFYGINPSKISGSYISCLKLIRQKMNESEEMRNDLTLVKCEGGILPVDTDQYKLLSLEMDAWKWSSEAKSMLEMTKAQKIKLEDVRKHIKLIATLRSKLPLNKKDKSEWSPEFEEELFSLVRAADKLLEEYESFIGDSGKKRRVSLSSVRQLKDAVNAQPLDLGSAAEHILSVWVASENWVREHGLVLKHCKIVNDGFDDKALGACITSPVKKITLATINNAVSQELELDLEEMFKLKTVSNRILKWTERSMQVTPLWTTEPRDRVIVDDKPDIDELFDLVEESKSLPVNVDEELDLLKKQINLVEEWRLTATMSMKVITQKFRIEHRKRAVETGTGCNFDEAEENSETASASSSNQNHSHNTRKRTGGSKSGSSLTHADIREAQEHAALTSVPLTEPLNSAPEMSMDDMIDDLLKASSKINVGTLEEELVEELVEVWEWYKTAKQVLTSPNDVIANPDSSYIEEIIRKGIDFCTSENPDETNPVLLDMCSSWKNLLLSEGYRLDKLWRRRNEFQVWREKVQNFVSPTEKGRFAMSTLKCLEEQCETLPEGIGLVQSFKDEIKTTYDWFDAARDALDNSKKLEFLEMKKVITRGEKIKVIPNEELKTLKQSMRQAKAWAMRARRVDSDSNETEAAAEVKKLLDEYVFLLVEMPDEIAKLKKATSIYCLCRETHSSGLMVACDECDEWYHGPCVGLTQALADRCEKYTCVRCLVTKSIRTSAERSVAKIRKWTDWGELIKARQVEGQKHQRKVRRERREIEKRTLEIEEGTRELSNLSEVEGGKVANRFVPKVVPQTPSIIAVAVSNQSPPTPSITGSGENVESSIRKPPNSVKLEDGPTSALSAKVAEPSVVDEEKSVAKEKIKKAQEIIQGCNERLSELEGFAHQRKDREEKENSMSSTLREWLSKVHRNIFKPASEEQIAASRPLPDAKISECMQTLIDESISLNIAQFPDIQIVNNSFHCFAWCLYAHTILDKKPKIEEIQVLLQKSEGITFPDERALKIIRGIYSRCKSWQDRARAALLPSIETKRPFDVAVLSKLFRELRNLPLFIAEESRVWNTIDDKGERHCLCGGPSDGTFMLACDRCGIWFHGACVGLDKQRGESLSKWHCPPCTEKFGEVSVAHPNEGGENSSQSSEKIEGDSTEMQFVRIPSPHAPDVKKLWPPLDVDKVAVVLDAIGKNRDKPPPPKKSPSVKIARVKRPLLGSAAKRSLSVGPSAPSRPKPAVPDQATSSKQAVSPSMGVPSGPVQPTAPVAQAAIPIANPFIAAPNLSALLNTGMMAPEATMMLSGTIAALNAGALLANSALFPGAVAIHSGNTSPTAAAAKRQRVEEEDSTNEVDSKRTKVDDDEYADDNGDETLRMEDEAEL